MENMSDTTRLALAANWANDTYAVVCDQLNRDGQIDHQALGELVDGLRCFADTLGALAMPYPPVPVYRRLELVR